MVWIKRVSDLYFLISIHQFPYSLRVHELVNAVGHNIGLQENIINDIDLDYLVHVGPFFRSISYLSISLSSGCNSSKGRASSSNSADSYRRGNLATRTGSSIYKSKLSNINFSLSLNIHTWIITPSGKKNIKENIQEKKIFSKRYRYLQEGNFPEYVDSDEKLDIRNDEELKTPPPIPLQKRRNTVRFEVTLSFMDNLL